MPRAQARKASLSWVGVHGGHGVSSGAGGTEQAGDVGERGHAKVDGLFLALQGGADLGELVVCRR